MTILHDLFKHSGTVTISEFMIWVETPESSDFLEESQALEYWEVATRVNKELRKPLSLTDFVRPAPQLPFIASDEDEEAFIESHEAWENWEPLFQGWDIEVFEDGGFEVYKESEEQPVFDHGLIIQRTDSVYRIDWGSGANDWDMITEEFSREDFIRECNRHSIPLIPVEQITEKPAESEGKTEQIEADNSGINN